MQAHYLSNRSQNNFIKCCGDRVREMILNEREKAFYLSIIVDATSDNSHKEQTTFILRYVYWDEDESSWIIYERFLCYVSCSDKSGEDIAKLILNTLEEYGIPISNCRGIGYDNGSNMAGKYKGAQAWILKTNSLAVFGLCATHSLNLCGVHAARRCDEVITFFVIVQKTYVVFSSCPRRWEILQDEIGSSLHYLSETRWSARIDAVKPFAAHLPNLVIALRKLLQDEAATIIKPETFADVKGILKFLKKSASLLLSSRYKVLRAIDIRNEVLQTKKITPDVEQKVIDDMVNELIALRNNFDVIVQEAEAVASVTRIATFKEIESEEARDGPKKLKRRRR